ncbi:MAG: NAD-dependent deacylase [Deltaproteobacteria bacterium]|nr:NAD-dependent deacylase [Deltaproteobacteria bacterium]
MTDELIMRAAKDIVKAKKTVSLTGAGMSVESDIAPFRGEGGIWEKYDPVEYAYIDVLRTNPGKTWILLSEMQEEILKAKPNPGHLSLAQLERMGFLSSIITQNVDGLHHEAGNKNVIEFHGNHRRAYCMECGKQIKSEEISLETLPPHCDCGGVIRPDVVFFGEAIPHEALTQSNHDVKSCDVMLVIGTSAEVQPAASLPGIAKSSGATIIEINIQETGFTGYTSDYFIKGKSGEILPQIIDKIKNESANLSS